MSGVPARGHPVRSRQGRLQRWESVREYGVSRGGWHLRKLPQVTDSVAEEACLPLQMLQGGGDGGVGSGFNSHWPRPPDI